MRFGVIGEPCIDFIHKDGVRSEKKLGGILYSVVSLAVISRADDEVYPIMNLGEDEYDNVISFLKKFPNIKQDYINKSEHKTRVVNLYYKRKSAEQIKTLTGQYKTYDREESSTEPTLPVSCSTAVNAISNIDALLVNFVSGIDITLETLKNIRKNFSGYIHMDLHNLVMKTSAEGKRTQTALDNWLEWCTITDTLQMNETEISIMTGENISEYITAERILFESTENALVITRGKLGVSMYEKKQKKSDGENYFELDRTDLGARENYNFIDSTGCGDVFASGFFFKNCVNNLGDFYTSLNYANKLSALKTSLEGVEGLTGLG